MSEQDETGKEVWRDLARMEAELQDPEEEATLFMKRDKSVEDAIAAAKAKALAKKQGKEAPSAPDAAKAEAKPAPPPEKKPLGKPPPRPGRPLPRPPGGRAPAAPKAKAPVAPKTPSAAAKAATPSPKAAVKAAPPKQPPPKASGPGKPPPPKASTPQAKPTQKGLPPTKTGIDEADLASTSEPGEEPAAKAGAPAAAAPSSAEPDATGAEAAKADGFGFDVGAAFEQDGASEPEEVSHPSLPPDEPLISNVDERFGGGEDDAPPPSGGDPFAAAAAALSQPKPQKKPVEKGPPVNLEALVADGDDPAERRSIYAALAIGAVVVLLVIAFLASLP